ncbi:hypothetical protein WKK05_35580 [Nostoc sp. UHCC 0302]|uniref:hypothetical protein n=1 Tax=Nostoc sp. UHCC 0302 TaxID=3134896 RepID=UPI00311CDA98
MSYVSLLKNIPDILSQPIGIAAIASLGIHGAIAMIVPLMPVDSSSKPKETSAKTVGLLELTPTDQSRLPQNPNTPQVALQPQLPLQGQISSPNFNSQSVLPPLPPTTANQFSLPPLPQSSSNYRVSSLPTRQSLRMIPRGDLGFNTSGFKTSEKFSSSVVPRLNDSDIKYEASKPLPVSELPELQPQKLPDDVLRDAQPPAVPQTNPVITAQENTTPQTPQPSNDASQVAESQPQLAPIGQPLQGADKLALAGQSLPPFQAATTRNIPELPSQVNESAIAQVNAYTDLRKIVRQEYPNVAEKAVIRDTISTDKPTLQGTVLGVLVVDPDGKVLDIKFQNKSVSPELQLKARQYFNTQPPKKDKQTSSYPFSLRFQNSDSNTNAVTQEKNPSFQATPKPFSIPQIRNNSQPLPSAATIKPLPELRIRSNQPAPSLTATPEPLSLPRVNNQSATSSDSGQKLIEQLRQVKEKRQKSE